MNPTVELFNSKLLLFGEYGLMYDAMALSVPFTRFYGSLAFDSSAQNEESTAEISKFHEYLTTINGQHYPLNLAMMKADLDKGLYFNSTIPLRYGLGSSGALIAALFSRYKQLSATGHIFRLSWLKADFALLESHFHGKSSGLDPLVSFLDCGILLNPGKVIQTLSLDLAQTGWAIALIDTKTTGATGPLVQLFVEWMKDADFNNAFQNQYLPASNGCIQSLLNWEKTSFFLHLRQLIHYELQYLEQMIPVNFRPLIKEALEQQVYLKLLGSGGGGYLLAFAPDENILKKWSERIALPLIKVV